MLAPEGQYYNYSGCGNTMNCNHPQVVQFILECLRYWVLEMHVDGFRFDLASIMTRAPSVWQETLGKEVKSQRAKGFADGPEEQSPGTRVLSGAKFLSEDYIPCSLGLLLLLQPQALPHRQGRRLYQQEQACPEY